MDALIDFQLTRLTSRVHAILARRGILIGAGSNHLDWSPTGRTRGTFVARPLGRRPAHPFTHGRSPWLSGSGSRVEGSPYDSPGEVA